MPKERDIVPIEGSFWDKFGVVYNGFFNQIDDAGSREADIKSIRWLLEKLRVYKHIPESDLRGRYELMYKIFLENNGKPAFLEPLPKSPNEIEEITDRDLMILEVDTFIVARFRYGMKVAASFRIAEFFKNLITDYSQLPPSELPPSELPPPE